MPDSDSDQGASPLRGPVPKAPPRTRGPSSVERAERGEIQRYLVRLMLVLFVGASVMVAVGLYAYFEFEGERGETTRRVPVTRHVGPGGSVQYVPAPAAPPP